MSKSSKSNKKASSSGSKPNVKAKTIEERFQKKDHHEHILERSGMYVGSIKKEKVSMWIYNEDRAESDAEFVFKEITYVPGLYKIFDEILVNARDHVVRCVEEQREPCTMIKVNIDKDEGKISVWNNGAGIPVVVHKEHNILIPSMIFGELLSSENYDDKVQRKVGGTNGLGAKLTNIFSIEFEVETVDADTNKKFYQKFTNNMYDKSKAKVTSASGKKSYTKITFVPDFERFGIKGLTNNFVSLFKKRIYDIAMTSTAKVYYNDTIVTANSFVKYVDLYFPDESSHKKVLDIADENWRICVVYDEADKLDHQNISFVNGICTSRGGTHVDHVSNQIVKKIQVAVAKKAKGLTIKPVMIKENLIFFIDSVIVNPMFDTQTKESLTTKVKDFGSSYQVTDALVKKIIKTGVVENIIINAQARAQANLEKTSGGRSNLHYEKLYDAHRAKLKKGDCTLILTEGDSAKTFVMSGLNVAGRDYYGAFPLRGKLLNVRDESLVKISNNEEIQAITKIVGLDYKRKDYGDLSGLRYGSIMILTDQDVDGSHIKGLIINYIHHYWPSLAKHEGFIKSFSTPLIKARKAKLIKEFYSMQEFEKWLKANNEGRGWSIKYYKGLGTHTKKESQECFQDVEDKLISYYWETVKAKPKEENAIEVYKPKLADPNEDAITLAFAKKRENDRKEWLNTYNPKIFLDNSMKKISYPDFIHKELIAFSVYDTARSVPHLMDGFKPGQRKVFFGCVKKNAFKTSIKVAQLSGYISEKTHYHHGEQSLNDTIIKMAQDHVGSNNLNMLVPDGQFGSRMSGGKDAASPRYIFTFLDDICKKIFIDHDNNILEKQFEDGDEIEPVFMAPIIPMILVNGGKGIGTGYSSTIEPCNPRDIISNLRLIIAGSNPKRMIPWYRHFTGTIQKIDNNKYVSRAKYDVIGDNTLHITDLPIGTWTDNYKAFLINLMESGAQIKTQNRKNAKAIESSPAKPAAKATTKAKGRGAKGGSKSRLAAKSKKSVTAKVPLKNRIGADIKSYTEDCTDIRISITIQFHPGKLKQHVQKGTLEKALKLVTPVNLTNMHLFNEAGKIVKYESYGAILKNFARVRLVLYQKRKDYLLGDWRMRMDMLKWKLKFVQAVRNEEIDVFGKKKDQVDEQLEELEYPKFAENSAAKPSYNYLTSMAIYRFTKDEVAKLKDDIKQRKEEIGILEQKSPADIWTEELDELEEAYDKWESQCDKEYDEQMNKKANAKKGTKRRVTKKK